MQHIFYVYLYLRNKNSKNGKLGTPYYVGKGSYNRAIIKHKYIHKPKLNENIIIYKDNLSEGDAFTLEIMLIARYGRLDNKTGILHNRTDGGEGVSGRPSIFKGKIKKSMVDRYDGENNPFYGKSHSEESKELISKHNGKGQAKVTPEEVREIRKLYKEKDITQREIAKLYGIAESTCNQIITKRWWKDVD